jgi:hypothetical protein
MLDGTPPSIAVPTVRIHLTIGTEGAGSSLPPVGLGRICGTGPRSRRRSRSVAGLPTAPDEIRSGEAKIADALTPITRPVRMRRTTTASTTAIPSTHKTTKWTSPTLAHHSDPLSDVRPFETLQRRSSYTSRRWQGSRRSATTSTSRMPSWPRLKRRGWRRRSTVYSSRARTIARCWNKGWSCSRRSIDRSLGRRGHPSRGRW